MNLSIRIGEIGAEWGPAATTARAVSAVLRRDRHAPVFVAIDSSGGSVLEAKRIAAALQEHRGPVVATVGRRCQSAANIVLIAAARRFAWGHSRFLLHRAAFNLDAREAQRFTAEDLRRMAADVERATSDMVDRLAERCAATRAWFEARVNSEIEFGPATAHKAGMVHAVHGLNLPGKRGTAAAAARRARALSPQDSARFAKLRADWEELQATMRRKYGSLRPGVAVSHNKARVGGCSSLARIRAGGVQGWAPPARPSRRPDL